MWNVIDLDFYMKNKDILAKIFDNIRLIDPMEKKLYNGRNLASESKALYCYEFWGKNKICDNCISVRALIEKQIFFKLEYKEKEICLIIAVPLQDGSKTIILELIKNVTNSMVVEDIVPGKNNLLDLLNNINSLQVHDSLTNILNRRYIDERLPIDLYNSQIANSNLCLVMADIDHFKNVNDTYGHVAGDHTLKEFAGILQKLIPESGAWVARYGGEEFLIIMNNVTLEYAETITEAIRKSVEVTQILFENNIIKITSSFGIVATNGNKGITSEGLIEIADKNLYKAKTNGRNRIESSYSS